MLLVAGAIFGGLGYQKYHQIQQMTAKFSKPQPPTPVEVVTVTRKQWQRTITGTGSFTATQDIFVSNEVPGVVASLHFDSGQTVTKGDALLTLDSTVDQAILNGLVAEQTLAEVQYERAAKLVRDKTMSQSQFDEAAAKRARAAADVVAQQAQIAKKTIRAPFSGTLGIRRADLGDYLAAGSSIVPLVTMDPIFLDSAIPERYLPQLRVGQAIRVHVQAYGNETFTGRLVALEPGVDPATRMIRVRAELANPEQRLRPGMFVEVEAIDERTDDVLVVPDTAITYSPYGDSVFVLLEKDHELTVERRQIEIGDNRLGEVAVKKGLAEGDRLVSVGQNKLRNGMRVVLATEAPLAAPTKQ